MQEGTDFNSRLRSSLVAAVAARQGWRWGRSTLRQVATVAVAAAVLIGVIVPILLLSSLGTRRGGDHAAGGGPPVPTQLSATSLQLAAGQTDVAIGTTYAWTSGPSSVTRITLSNMATTTFSTMRLGDSSEVAVGPGSIWVTSEAGWLLKLDPSTGTVTDTINVTNHAEGVAVDSGFVYVTTVNDTGSQLLKVDASTDSITSTLSLPGAGAGPLTLVNGVLWITNTSAGGSVTRVIAASMTVTDTILSGVQGAVTSVGSYVWAATGDGLLQVNPITGLTTMTVSMSRASEGAGAGSTLWVLTAAGSTDSSTYEPDPNQPETVVMVDPTTGNTLFPPAALGFTPASLAVSADGSSAWVVDYDAGLLWRVTS